MLQPRSKGINWAGNVNNYARILNEGACKVLGLKSSFEI